MSHKMMLASIFPGEFVLLVEELEAKQCPDVREEIVQFMARTIFVEHWIRQEEEAGRSHGGQELFDVAPVTSPDAYYVATKYAVTVEKANLLGLNQLYAACAAFKPAQHLKPPTPTDFGFCLVMEALGTGVGWADNHPDPGIQTPYMEQFLE